MKHYENPNAVCPFYMHESASMVYCEGVTDLSVTHEAFPDRASAREYKKWFCHGKHYKECLHYQRNERKYKNAEN